MAGIRSWILLVLASLLLGLPAQAQQVLGANDQPIHDAARIGSGKEVTAILTTQPLSLIHI